MENTIQYRQVGDYYLPDLSAPEVPDIGIWGRRRRDYLLKHRHGIYTAFLLSGKLGDHLAEIDRQAGEMFALLVAQMAEREGVTEQLKAENQMAWVGRMNNIRERATEMVNSDLIYN